MTELEVQRALESHTRTIESINQTTANLLKGVKLLDDRIEGLATLIDSLGAVFNDKDQAKWAMAIALRKKEEKI